MRLPTRQDGIEKRDKVYTNHTALLKIKVPENISLKCVSSQISGVG